MQMALHDRGRHTTPARPHAAVTAAPGARGSRTATPRRLRHPLPTPRRCGLTGTAWPGNRRTRRRAMPGLPAMRPLA